MRIELDGFKLVVAGICVALVAGGVSNMVRSDIDSEQQNYCRFVKETTWPDYKGTYARDCGGEQPPVYRKPKLSKGDERIVLTM